VKLPYFPESERLTVKLFVKDNDSVMLQQTVLQLVVLLSAGFFVSLV
jgi:hypothetical protein